MIKEITTHFLPTFMPEEPTKFALGLVLTVQLGIIPSKQSTIGERYTFPAGIENSVMLVRALFWLFPLSLEIMRSVFKIYYGKSILQ